MRIAVLDTRRYDREAFERANANFGHDIAHQEFLTHEALDSIAATTLDPGRPAEHSA